MVHRLGGLAVAPGCVVFPAGWHRPADADTVLQIRKPRTQGLHHGEVFGVHQDQGGGAVVEHDRDLGGRQPPVERGEHGTAAYRAGGDFHEFDAVLAQPGHVTAWGYTQRLQGPGHLVGAAVQQRKRHLGVAGNKGDGVGPRARVEGHGIGQGQKLGILSHGWFRRSMVKR